MLGRMKEVDVAGFAVAYMKAQGWEVYQEVDFGGSRADIVATQGEEIMVVEAKAAMTFALLEQAIGWKQYADRIVVVTPLRKNVGKFALVHCLDHLQFGWWSICQESVHVEVEPPKLEAGLADRLRESLCDEQKNYAEAGTSGKYWTPYKAFAKAVKEAVEKSPGLPVKEIIWRVNHHYASSSSAIANLRKGAELGWIEGVELRKVEGKMCLFPQVKVKAS